jgi:hypothetical protein
MNNLKEIAIGVFTGLLLTIFMFAMVTEASTGMMSEDAEGRIFSSQTGYFKVQGKTYYAHHSKSAMYEKHELLTNGYRVRNNKLYYFGADGAMVTKKTRRDKSTRYIDFNKDGSVHCIYPAGRGEPYERYNANHRRYQVRKHGKWKDIGQQVWPYGLIDHQW